MDGTMKLTEAQRRRITKAAPFIGFAPGSNLWPFAVYDEGAEDEISGEEIDLALREGLLTAVALAVPVITDKSPDTDILPHCECTHELFAATPRIEER